MSNTFLEILRKSNEEIETLEKTLLLVFEAMEKKPSEEIYHEIMLQTISKKIVSLSEITLSHIDNENINKQAEIDVLSGFIHYEKQILQENDEEKPDLLRNYYDMIKNSEERIKEYNVYNDYYKDNNKNKFDVITIPSAEAYYQFYYDQAIRENKFTELEDKGKAIDLKKIFDFYLNFKELVDVVKESNYTEYLKVFWQFDFSIDIKRMTKYKEYLILIEKEFFAFYLKSKPLIDVEQLIKSLNEQLENFKISIDKEDIGDIEIPILNYLGRYWLEQMYALKQNIFDEETEFVCDICDKVFINEFSYNQHINGKNHKKKAKQMGITEKEINTHKETKKEIVFMKLKHEMTELIELEFLILLYVDYFSNNIENAINNQRLKDSKNYLENSNMNNKKDLNIDEINDVVNKTKEDDQFLINLKKIPLGWDGKPIPYWLFKLNNLDKEYTCEICGNKSYKGRKAFEIHFQEWRHAYGMACLKVPNTIHFKGVTKIEEVYKLHKKMIESVKSNNAKIENEEEIEDKEGNVYSKAMYLDLKQQGLLD